MIFTIGQDSAEITYRLDFSESTALFYIVLDSDNEEAVVDQPWYPLSNGSRLDWDSAEQAINWFKNERE